MADHFPLDMYDIARFFSKVDVREPTACWNFLGGLSASEYGTFSAISEKFYAHRISYFLFHGKIPDGLLVRHKCDNPRCVNPYHLETGTTADNMMDRKIRNRVPMGIRNGNAKLTEDSVRQILVDKRRAPALAREYGVSSDTILRIRKNQQWKHIPRDGLT